METLGGSGRDLPRGRRRSLAESTWSEMTPRVYNWIGGANVPTLGGLRVNAGYPLASLSLENTNITLRLRGRISFLFRSELLFAGPSDVSDVFAIESKLRFRGVGFRRTDGHEFYFKTGRAKEILPVLHEAGFSVSELPKPASKIWKFTP